MLQKNMVDDKEIITLLKKAIRKNHKRCQGLQESEKQEYFFEIAHRVYQAVIGKMNVDENSGVPVKFGVRSIPTLLFFKNGEVVDKQVGAVPKNVLAEKITAQLN